MRRLLLIDPGGRAVLHHLDSGERNQLDISDSGGVLASARTATWSTAGQWAAFAVDTPDLDGVHEVRLRDAATGEVRVTAAELTAFYLCPSPCGRYLSHLSPGPLGLELGVSNVETGELTIIERGQPLFWSWAPDSLRIAVHVQNRVHVVSLDGGEHRVLTESAGSFVAPWWSADRSIVIVADDQIVSHGPDGVATALVTTPGPGRFALDPNGRRLAFVDLLDGLPALVVLDLLTRDRDVVAAERTAGFFWSPEGRRLAALVIAGPAQVQWLVWDGVAVVRLAPFRPGTGWVRGVLPFFEQYSQSHTVWSGDGTQLVAPALDADGSTEAVVQSVDGSTSTERVPGAHLAWWAN